MPLLRHLLCVMSIHTCVRIGQSVPIGKFLTDPEPLTHASEMVQIQPVSGTPAERPSQLGRTRNASQVLLKLLNKLQADQNMIRKMSHQIDPKSSSLQTLLNDLMDNADSVHVDSEHTAGEAKDLRSKHGTIRKLSQSPFSAVIDKNIKTISKNIQSRYKRSISDQGSRSLRELLDNNYDDQLDSAESEQQGMDNSLDDSVLDGTVERHLTTFLSDMLKVFEYDLKNMAREYQGHKSSRRHHRRHDRPESRPKRSIHKMFHEDPTIREILMKYLKLKGNDRSGKHQLRFG